MTGMAHALVDAIAGHDDSGRAFPPDHSGLRAVRGARSSVVRVTREAVRSWRCCACRQSGIGWVAMRAHVDALHHHEYEAAA